MKPLATVSLSALVAAALLSVAAPAGASHQAERRPGSPGWHVVASPNVGQHANEFAAVEVTSANDAWAVGTTQVIPQGQAPHNVTLIERWNGTSWRATTSPNIGTNENDLFAVSATSANDAWAVGNYFDEGTLAWKTLALHWDGGSWIVVPTPSPSTRFATLDGVVAIAPNDVWAVGARQTSGSTIRNRPLIEHWDGTAWKVANGPMPHSDNVFLQGVAAGSSGDVWAVGFAGAKTLIEHFDGAAWKIIPSPSPAPRADFLHSVVAISPADAWAVGGMFLNQQGTSERTLAEHWDGTKWSVVSTPNQGSLNNQLLGVTAIGSSDVWAVGLFVISPQNENQTLTEKWDGTQWAIVGSPSPGSGHDVLLGAAASPDGSVWAVGGFEGPPEQTLVLRHQGP
jgi:hypothetical protein